MAPRRQRVVVKTWLEKAIGNSRRSLAFGETITEAWWSRFNFVGTSAHYHWFKGDTKCLTKVKVQSSRNGMR
jgi:hypothetical protein